jgi:hypothetical protein
MIQFARRALIGAAVVALAATAAYAQENRNVRVHNDTGVTLTHLYSTNSGQADWGSDILGADVIASGESVVVDFDDGTDACLFDVKARFADGDEMQLRQINVCRATDITFD